MRSLDISLEASHGTITDTRSQKSYPATATLNRMRGTVTIWFDMSNILLYHKDFSKIDGGGLAYIVLNSNINFSRSVWGKYYV